MRSTLIEVPTRDMPSSSAPSQQLSTSRGASSSSSEHQSRSASSLPREITPTSSPMVPSSLQTSSPSRRMPGDTLTVTFHNTDSSENRSVNSYSNKPIGREAINDVGNDNLVGFVPSRHKRQKYSAIFVSGIMLKNENIKETIECINKHITKQGCTVRGIWKIKQTGVTMSVKAVVPQDQVDHILSDRFWQKGVMCREWIERETDY